MESSRLCSFSKPANGFFTVDEPARREDRWAFERLLPRIRKRWRHHERESSNAGTAIAGNDVRVPPGHYTITEFMPEFDGVDQKPARPCLLRLCRNQA